MGLKSGIVGLPNSGKSSLFKALTSIDVNIENFPYTTTESNIGIVNVPDKRLYKLSEIEKPQKTIPNTVDFIDIAGLAKGASTGEGIGNKFLDQIRHCDSLIHIIRCFDNDSIIHVNNKVDPLSDKEEVDLELQFKDLESVEKFITKNQKVAKSGNKEAKFMLDLLLEIKKQLEDGGFVRDMSFNKEELKAIKGFSFLTNKRTLYVANVGDSDINTGNKYVEQLRESIAKENSELIFLNAKLEAEIQSLEEEEKQEFMEMYELAEPGVNKLINSAYKLLGLITYFTVGPKEVRAWSTLENSTAPQAAGVIHSDFEKGFIRAEMIKYDDFINLGSEQACKDAAKFQVVGKNYIVQDGDLLHFLFNV
ncbi:MAG: redox-regulated ATPase YchF [Bacteroidota bacterium]|nr:redox-regulated ATPase YchF [Bacteroidota bacterium]